MLNIEGGGVGVTHCEGGEGGFEVAVGQQGGRQLESAPTCPASPRQGVGKGSADEITEGTERPIKKFPSISQ